MVLRGGWTEWTVELDARLVNLLGFGSGSGLKCWLHTAHNIVKRTRGGGTTDGARVQLQPRLLAGCASCSEVRGLVCRAGVFRVHRRSGELSAVSSGGQEVNNRRAEKD